MSDLQKLLSTNLKAIRKAKKLNQSDIEKHSGILASTYSRIETGQVIPNLSSLEKIADALDVPVAELFTSQKVADKSVLQKLEIIESLSDYNKNVVEILLDTIIEKDTLEKTQDLKMNKRLLELEKVRKK